MCQDCREKGEKNTETLGRRHNGEGRRNADDGHWIHAQLALAHDACWSKTAVRGVQGTHTHTHITYVLAENHIQEKNI